MKYYFFLINSILNLGVVALNGLLYVVSGNDEDNFLHSTECYNPNTNTWTVVTASMNVDRITVGAVTINRPQHFKTFQHS